ncbi:hypothetical protein ACFL6Y_07530 [Elusimicrobiota bacterium]
MTNIIGGLIALALGIVCMLCWWWRVLELVQGLLPVALIVGGLVAVFAGLSTTEGKSKKKAAKEEAA